jgi:site-specific recombinase XerD
MKLKPDLAPLLESFFTQHLLLHRQVSQNTVATYRDTFRLLLSFVHKQSGKTPSQLSLADLNADIISDFLDDLEKSRGVTVRSRNLRLTAIRSFFRYVSFQAPDYAYQIQQVLSFPNKRQTQRQIDFLTNEEVKALLSVPDTATWCGHRDYVFMLTAIQTGMRLSEMTQARLSDVHFGTGSYIQCQGKGRKERCTPFTKNTVTELKNWLMVPKPARTEWLFPSVRGGRLSADAVQHFVKKYADVASQYCSSLKRKRVTPHIFRHAAAMSLLQAGVDIAVIALWLGHVSIRSTQVYLDASLALKEAALEKAPLLQGKTSRYRPPDKLLSFLNDL